MNTKADHLFKVYEEFIDKAMKLPPGDLRAQIYDVLHDTRIEIMRLDLFTKQNHSDEIKQEKVVSNKLIEAHKLLHPEKFKEGVDIVYTIY